MSMLELIYHKHYWSIPHTRESDSRIVQICYDCGKERVSPISLGSYQPVESRISSEDQACTLDSAEQAAPAVEPPGLQRPAPHADLLEAIAKRFYWKKKLAGS